MEGGERTGVRFLLRNRPVKKICKLQRHDQSCRKETVLAVIERDEALEEMAAAVLHPDEPMERDEEEMEAERREQQELEQMAAEEEAPGLLERRSAV